MDIGKEVRVIEVEVEPVFLEPLLLDEVSEWPPNSVIRAIGDSEGGEAGN